MNNIIRRFVQFCVIVTLGVSSAGVVSYAEAPTPRVKPAAPNPSKILGIQDAKNFRLAMDAADRRSWSEVERIESMINDPLSRQILMWRRAADSNQITLAELKTITTTMSDWPRMVPIRARAERMMFEDPPAARFVLDWFSTQEPVSGEGMAALARAHFAVGNTKSGQEWLRKAWRESRLTRDRQKTLFSEMKGRLTPEDHAARADHLVWHGPSYYSSAEAILPLMPRAEANLIDARIRVGANRSGMDSAINRLSNAQAVDTGLLFERGRWRRKRKSKDYAMESFGEIKRPASTERGKERMWTEQKIMGYWLMGEKRYREAYDFVSVHGMTEGADFAGAEFMSGWLALRYLNDPQTAMRHFTTLHDNVSMPVSVARGAYWQGRAAEALGQDATIYYAAAARHQNTFYGQLAYEKIQKGGYLTLPPELPADHIKPQFEARSVVRATRLIGESGNDRSFRQFAFHLDDTLESPEELILLSALAREYGYNSPGVRAAKQAGRFNTILTESSYPMPRAITELGPGYDIPFTLAIARQESEFDTSAVSSARAYGMMQMIDATARTTARKHGLTYSRSRMVSDQAYAARMGSLHLNDLLEDYDGSYIMAAIAYNAGPTRVRQWTELYGDPRKGEIDPVDFLESIPFSETRNYVQRVLENLQVYRARLNGNQAPLTLSQDLRRGSR